MMSITMDTFVLILASSVARCHHRSPTYSNSCRYKQTSDGLSAYCDNRRLQEVPCDLPKEITSLDLNENNITRITNSSFDGLQMLKILSLTTNNLQFIAQEAFSSLPLLQYVGLDENRLQKLPSDLFSKTRNLQMINLSGNKFTSIPVHALTPLKGLRKLLMDRNNIIALNFTGFPSFEVSEMVLSFSMNNISVVGQDDFRGLANVRINVFYLNRIDVFSLPDSVFRALNLVEEVDLGHNRIKNFSFCSLFGMTSLKNVSVKWNNIAHIIGFSNKSETRHLDIPPLKNLIFSFNRIRIIPSKVFVGLDKLVSLALDNCKITFILNNSFVGLLSLEILDLRVNNITSVNPQMFLNMKSLHKLILKENEFSVLNPGDFRELNSVVTLDLSVNKFQKSKFNATWALGSLKTFDLSYIKMPKLYEGVFHGLNNLTELSLSSSNIDQFEKGVFVGLDQLSNLSLSNLRLRNLIEYFTDLKNLTFLDLSRNDFGISPYAFRGLTSLLTLKLSRCNLVSTNLVPKTDSVFVFTPRLQDLDLHINSLNNMNPATFQQLKDLRILHLESCQIKYLHVDIFRNLSSLHTLFLYKNLIKSLESKHFRDLSSLSSLTLNDNQLSGIISKDLFGNSPRLSILALSNNGITGIETNANLPSTMLDLYGNPISCECDLKWFRLYFETSNLTLNNANKTLCSATSISKYVGQPFLNFQPHQACSPRYKVYVISSVLVFCFILFIAIAYRNRWWLSYKWYLAKLLFVGYIELEDGREHLDYDYDINIIFPDDDEEWVKENFLPALVENLPDFARDRIVCGEDDLPLGGARLNAIDYVIDNSFKTFVIVSNSSFSDVHFNLQLRMAVEQMNEVELEKVVVIFKEDVPQRRIPYLVRLFLSKNKPYFQWDEDENHQNLFWAKLAKAMRGNKQINVLLPI